MAAPRARGATPAEKTPNEEARRRAAWRAGQDAKERTRARIRRVAEFLWPTTTRRVPRPRAVAILILNIIPFPGLGTIIYGQWERGLLQFLLTFLIIGWAWAILDGIRITRRAWGPPAWSTR